MLYRIRVRSAERTYTHVCRAESIEDAFSQARRLAMLFTWLLLRAAFGQWDNPRDGRNWQSHEMDPNHQYWGLGPNYQPANGGAGSNISTGSGGSQAPKQPHHKGY
jgi:hypothetical protein